ncbi:Mitogen-activated protein kinase HOG1 [Penicillium canescens]|nr:Mitogen-activated protein kinase HOG1 [Penicillium canescens]
MFDLNRFSPKMGPSLAQFTRISIMGSVFETTKRYDRLESVGMGISRLVWFAASSYHDVQFLIRPFILVQQEIKSQIEQSRTAVVTKRMFREVKLLIQFEHENVRHSILYLDHGLTKERSSI